MAGAACEGEADSTTTCTSSALLGCIFETERLLVQELEPTFSRWGCRSPLGNANSPGPASTAVASLLTEEVTKPLPPRWQGPYSPERAQQWIADLIREPMTTVLFAVAKETRIESRPTAGHEDLSKMVEDSLVARLFSEAYLSFG